MCYKNNLITIHMYHIIPVQDNLLLQKIILDLDGIYLVAIQQNFNPYNHMGLQTGWSAVVKEVICLNCFKTE